MIGRSVRRIDGVAKVTGEAVFGIDHEEPRMLHGKILRSPTPSGRIVRLDVSKAEAMPGRACDRDGSRRTRPDGLGRHGPAAPRRRRRALRGRARRGGRGRHRGAGRRRAAGDRARDRSAARRHRAARGRRARRRPRPPGVGVVRDDHAGHPCRQPALGGNGRARRRRRRVRPRGRHRRRGRVRGAAPAPGIHRAAGCHRPLGRADAASSTLRPRVLTGRAT